MTITDFVAESDVHLELRGTTKDEILAELVGHLGMSDEDSASLLKIMQRREALGSTGIGNGIAIPHCRTPLARRLRVVFGRKAAGVPYDAVDAQPVSCFFLLIAPPVEVSNDYLPVLGKIAQVVKEPDARQRMGQATSAPEFLSLLAEKGG